MKTKIIIDDKSSKESVTGAMEIGDAGIVIDSRREYDGMIILKTYAGYISLLNPRASWANEPNFKIQPIKELIISYII